MANTTGVSLGTVNVREVGDRTDRFVEECTAFVNSFGVDSRRFAEGMTRQHRTLQQSFTRLVVAFLRAEAQASSDARNEAAVKAAKAMIDAFDESGLNLPMI